MILSKLLFILLLFSQPIIQFEGDWQDNHPNAGESFIFNLELYYDNDEIIGRHCFADSGGWDCAADDEYTLNNYELISSTIIEMDYITGYGLGAESADDFVGRVRFTLIDNNTLKWEIIERSGSISLVPDVAEFNREVHGK